MIVREVDEDGSFDMHGVVYKDKRLIPYIGKTIEIVCTEDVYYCYEQKQPNICNLDIKRKKRIKQEKKQS